MLSENEQFVVDNYNNNGGEVCQEKIGMNKKDFANLLKRLRRKGYNLLINKKTRSKISSMKAKRQDYSKRSNVNADMFIGECTKECAYILGMLWADGYLNNKSQTNMIRLELVKDDMDDIVHLFDGWGVYERQRKNRRLQKHVTCSNKKLYEYLVSCDYDKKSFMSADKILSFKSDNFIRHWLRGFFDGDGSIRKVNNNSYQLTFENYKTWNKFQKFCEKFLCELFDVPYKNHQRFNCREYSCLTICKKELMKDIKKKCEKLNLPILKRKWEKIKL